MARNVTRWQPDTCDCIFDYEWDDSDPSVITHRETIQVCAAHAAVGHSKDKACYDAVRAENVLKNMTFAEAQKANPSIRPEHFSWSFDKDRNMTTDFSGKLASKAKIAVETAARSATTKVIGVGK